MEENRVPKEDAEEKPGLFFRLRSVREYISLISAVVGGVAVVGGGIVFLAVQELRDFALVIVIVGAVLLLLAMTFSPREVLAALVGRRGRYGVNTLIMTVAFLAIVVLVNVLAFRNITRFDVTATKQFSLAPQTLKVLKNLEEPVRATAFFVPGDVTTEVARGVADDLLNEFERRSSRFEYRFVDPDQEPPTARQFEITQYGTIVFEGLESGQRWPVITPIEQEFTTALLVVTGVQQKKVYFLTGHEERAMNDVTSDGGFGFAAQGIQGDSYLVQPLNLLQRGHVPEDAAVLVIAGPKKDLVESEVEPLYQYLKGGGGALLLLDPDAPQTFRDLLGRWAIGLGDGSIVDVLSFVNPNVKTPLLQRASGQYSDLTPITSVIDVSFFPGATSITASEECLPVESIPGILECGANINVVALAATSSASWLETDAEDINFDEEVDTPGPLLVAAALQATAPLGEKPDDSLEGKLTNIVVFGDSDFASNRFYTSSSNGDLLVNSVNWLAEDYDLISIRVKPFIFRELVLTSREFDFIKWSSWFLMPAVVTLLGAVIWWRRR